MLRSNKNLAVRLGNRLEFLGVYLKHLLPTLRSHPHSGYIQVRGVGIQSTVSGEEGGMGGGGRGVRDTYDRHDLA